MAVDIRLNDMINALDRRLREIGLDDCELSVRTLNALRKIGAETLWDAQGAILNRTLIKQYGIGPKAVREVQEIIDSVSLDMPPLSDETHDQLHQRIELQIGDILDANFDDPTCGASVLCNLLTYYLEDPGTPLGFAMGILNALDAAACRGPGRTLAQPEGNA